MFHNNMRFEEKIKILEKNRSGPRKSFRKYTKSFINLSGHSRHHRSQPVKSADVEQENKSQYRSQ
jgi:hypothetical protein